MESRNVNTSTNGYTLARIKFTTEIRKVCTHPKSTTNDQKLTLR